MKINFIEKIKKLFTRQNLLNEGKEYNSEASNPVSTTAPVSTTNSSPEPIKLENLEIDTYLKNMENSTPAFIHSSISAKQSYLLLNLLDMSYVAATADNLIYLTRPFKVASTSKKSKENNDLYEKNTNTFNENFETNKKSLRKLAIHMNTRNQLFERIREIYPDFGLHMQEKTSPEDYETYISSKKDFKKTLLKQTSYSNDSDLEDILEDKRNNISRVIDSKKFSKACQIEDTFILSELGIFLDKFSELPQDKQAEFRKVKITKSKKSKVDIIDFINRLKNETTKRLEKYKTIQDLYKKMENHPYINLIVENTQEEQPFTDDDSR